MSIVKRAAAAFFAVVMVIFVFSPSAFATEKSESIELQPIQENIGFDEEVVQPSALLSPGKHIRYPAEGGTWEYGFWNAYCRSYYTVNKNHGSTVKVGNSTVRSIDTASDKKSIAEKFALNFFSGEDKYYYRINK
ncbi:MAG: lactococcin 972 family bacteriocin [Oscillospiraceae bacterium]|nr:lactococcin 972 family bacteriocin [Oscillospiraceae bacterium]